MLKLQVGNKSQQLRTALRYHPPVLELPKRVQQVVSGNAFQLHGRHLGPLDSEVCVVLMSTKAVKQKLVGRVVALDVVINVQTPRSLPSAEYSVHLVVGGQKSTASVRLHVRVPPSTTNVTLRTTAPPSRRPDKEAERMIKRQRMQEQQVVQRSSAGLQPSNSAARSNSSQRTALLPRQPAAAGHYAAGIPSARGRSLNQVPQVEVCS
jgi:hypothetical protein